MGWFGLLNIEKHVDRFFAWLETFWPDFAPRGPREPRERP